MIKNKFIGITFFYISIVFFSKAQIQPHAYTIDVKYEMTYQPDSTDSSNKKSEFMTLLIGKNQSLFCATQYLVMDSAIKAENVKGNKFGPPMSFFMQYGTKNNLVIFKDATNLFVYDCILRFVSSDIVTYEEPKNQFNWKVLADTLTIGGVLCQKAETTFGNRNWEAWFAPSIPISDGPYKFNGLPGLILRVYDKKKYWYFDIASLQNINKNLKVNFNGHEPMPIKDKEIFFARRRYSMDNRFLLEKQSGSVFSNEVSFRRQYEDEAKRDNNWIELYRPKK